MQLDKAICSEKYQLLALSDSVYRTVEGLPTVIYVFNLETNLQICQLNIELVSKSSCKYSSSCSSKLIDDNQVDGTTKQETHTRDDSDLVSR